MSEINIFFKKIKELNKKILENNFMKILSGHIIEQVSVLFPSLNTTDLDIMQNLAIYLHNDIFKKIVINDDISLIEQFTQNNFRDIKSIILMIIPFVSDIDNNVRLRKLVDLNQILYRKIGATSIDKKILTKERNDALSEEFWYSNFALGLLNDTHNMLELIDKNGDKLIHKIIYHNFNALTDTIRMCNNKYYVNWINIVPISENNFEEEDIFKNTTGPNGIIKLKDFEIYNGIDRSQDEIEFYREYNGLWEGDYYNVLRKGYYQSIKPCKWLIYNRYNLDRKKSQYYLQVLNEKFNLEYLIDSKVKAYLDLPDNEKIRFKKDLNTLLNSLDNSDNSLIYLDLIKNLLIYLVNGYKYRYKIKYNIPDKFQLQKENNEFIEEDIFEDLKGKNKDSFNSITLEDVLLTTKGLGEEIIWDFLKESIDYFQSTIYSTFLINDANKINDEFFYIKIKGNETGINLKNLYNISKLFSHSNLNLVTKTFSDEWKLLNENYIGLSQFQKNIFFRNFLNNNVSENFKRNIRIEVQFNSNTSESSRINQINQGWYDFKHHFIFIYLIRRGLLSKFLPDFKFTNKLNLPSGYGPANKRKRELLKSKFNNNKEWENCYYYLNNKKYSQMDKIRHSEKPDFPEEKYFDVIHKYHAWYGFYAMDWITQINFFHTFINHQIIFVTGSTGTGKSTQVPKLLLYALKMIDYKENGSIICTQPRIPPTLNNTERISFELGLPVNVPSHTLKNEKVNTQNFYCQYKYQGAQHTTNTKKHLSLKIVTDGTLFEEIKTNQIMKEQIPGKTNNKYDFVFSERNKYDILIIDEAHEHNSNMDLILTMARNACYFNNSLRLVIISATMDDDEPIYRSYFQVINDNIIYPIKQPNISKFGVDLKTPILTNCLFLDRRFHISPPGETTQYNIDEIYRDLPETNSQGESDNNINSKIGQEEAYKVIQEICSQSSTGEILLFSTGEKEIKDAVKYLNENLPAGNVALPYFGTMNPKYKEIIEKIDKNISKIKNQRTKIFEEWGTQFIQDNSVPNGIYKRSIIVATNVAEASVTINGLKYVVDNGYAKEAYYNELTGSSELRVEKISEASRLQRKGRVGRTADGTVYYMYKKDARKNIMPKYKINQNDPELIFSQLSTKLDIDENYELNEFYPKFLDPHISLTPDLTDNKFIKELEKKFNRKKNNIQWYKNGLINVIIKQFYSNQFSNEFYPYSKIPHADYFPSPYFDYLVSDNDKLIKRPNYLNTFIDGITIDNLFDRKCKFFLINPKEDKIIRNCNNSMIKKKTVVNGVNVNKLEDEIPLRFFDVMLFNLQFKFKVVDLKLNYYLYKDVFDNYELDFKKTLFCEKVFELVGKLNLPENMVITIMNAYGHSARGTKDILNSTLMIISLLSACNYSVKNLAIPVDTGKGYSVPDFEELKKHFWSDYSDLEVLYRIVNKIKNNFYKLKIFKLDDKYYNLYYEKFIETIKRYEIAIKQSKNNYDPPEEFTKDWNKLNELRDNNKLKNETGFQSWLESSRIVKDDIFKDINDNRVEISDFCKKNGLEFSKIMIFFNNYLSLKLNIDTMDRNEDQKSMNENPFIWIDKYFKVNFESNLSNLSDVEKIVQSFIAGNFKNIICKFDINNNYYNYTYIHNKITNIQTVNSYSNEYLSFVKNPGNLIFYLNTNAKTEMVEIITKISFRELISSNPFYFNPLNFKKSLISVDENNNNLPFIIENKGLFFEDLLLKISNSWNMNNFVWKNLSPQTAEKDIDLALNTYINNVNKLTLQHK
jgi:hypothetical protein